METLVKIWIVSAGWYREGAAVLGVFSSEVLARAFVEGMVVRARAADYEYFEVRGAAVDGELEHNPVVIKNRFSTS
jgi:hypothetical protein